MQVSEDGLDMEDSQVNCKIKKFLVARIFRLVLISSFWPVK